ncbi:MULTISPECIES: LacI family DNA-binding transcriptional regulator [Metabacillus]|uniref:LacI family transcriptional regulator n=2 Tax=Metabacillus TaxID=2675233 RepID=A0A179T007_9BACI|nr:MULTISPECIES: LacI family DNA-binding transcriptional regulator [Metabacillus]OAS86838.1 LacI family transcriptional regulator [Metabacillus litoralis]QNF29088.1 LacI family DNA-binding transcriptional regulator [Metabacillus sp. KUDC1714]
MAVTIKDVAKVANVTPSTVSRVISNSPRISEKTKRKVRQAMEELGYLPNFKARSLANRSTQTIGLVMPNSTDKVFQNPFFPEVIRGISKIAHSMEYALHISTGETEEEIYEGLVRMVQSGRVDGVILLYSRINDNVMSFLEEKKFPYTIIGKPYLNSDEISHVDNDNFSAAKEVTKYLLKLGHKRIGFVAGSLNLMVTLERKRGYESALLDSDITINNDYIVHEEFLREGGQEAISELLSLKEPPTSLVVADDLMAFGMLNTLDEMGLRVPDDISIISFNNLLLSEVSRPPLTSVDINIYNLGLQSAKCLIEKIKQPDEPAKRIIIPYKVIERNSCKKLS